MMRRPALLISLALAGCGARTALGDLAGPNPGVDASFDGPSDAALEAGPEAPSDAPPPPDAPPRLCPLTPPDSSMSCPISTMITRCAYVASLTPVPDGLVAWCCVQGGWTPCTTVSQSSQSCTQILCDGQPLECIVGGGKQCCVCSSDGTLDNCGSC